MKQFPEWVIKPIGEPIFLDSDWDYLGLPNGKYGMFADGTGSISPETKDFFYGGSGSCKMITDAVSNHSSEVKTLINATFNDGDLLAFEMKWGPTFAFAGSAFDFGMEPRDNVNIVHARMRYSITTGEWKYQDTDQTFKSFPTSVGGPLTPEKPIISQSGGNSPGWARLIVDPVNRTYYGFEASGKAHKIETRKMASMNQAMCIQGSSSSFQYLYFVLIIAGGAGVEIAYTTDWCISRIPAGIDPFNGTSHK